MHIGPDFCTPRPGARARAKRVTSVLSVVVVALLLGAAPAFARAPGGDGSGGHGRSSGPEDAGAAKQKPGRHEPPGPPAARSAAVAAPPALADATEAPPVVPSVTVESARAVSAPLAPPATPSTPGHTTAATGARAAAPRAEPVASIARRSFTPLLLLLGAVLVFLAVHGRVDRRGTKRADGPGEFRRFR